MAGSATPRIAIVGPCASGKSTLAARLQGLGYRARQIAQEHSYVPDMWQVLTRPDFLVYLDANYETCTRRKQLNWTRREYDEQQHRLRHARQHCDLLIDTTDLTSDEVEARVRTALSGGQWPGVGV